MFDEFDKAICNVNMLEARLFQRKVSQIENFPIIEKTIIKGFQKICKDSALNKKVFFVDMEEKKPTEKILFLSKLYFDTNIYKIFGEIVGASNSKQGLGKYIKESEFGIVIDLFILKIQSKQLSFEEFFLIKFFSLQVLLSKFLVLKIEQAESICQTNPESTQLSKLEEEFDTEFLDLDRKYKGAISSLSKIAQIKENEYCGLLFDQDDLEHQEFLLTASWPNASCGSADQLNINHLWTFDCWFKRKIYYLVCFRRKSFQVLTKANHLSEQEMRKLYIYLKKIFSSQIQVPSPPMIAIWQT